MKVFYIPIVMTKSVQAVQGGALLKISSIAKVKNDILGVMRLFHDDDISLLCE